MKLLERMAAVGARRRLAASTVNCYAAWAGDFLRFCRGGADGRWRHPRDLGAADVERFLTHLARDRRLSASSQNQALNAVVFLYKQLLADELPAGHLGRFEAERSRRPVRVPTVLSAAEVERLIAAMEAASAARLMVELMYGTGLRVAECCTLRGRDVDFDRRQVVVRGGKGDKDRLVMLPDRCVAALADQARRVRHRHARDVERGGGYAPLPAALANKAPYAGRDWRWQLLFPGAMLRRDTSGRSGHRSSTDPSALDRKIKRAARDAGLAKRVSAHTLRHRFATHLLEAGYDVRQVQTLFGHERLETTMRYTHVTNRPAVAVTSPLDRLATA